MKPIRGRGRERVDRRGSDCDGGRCRSRDGWRDYGRDGDGGHGTPEPTLPPLSPTPVFAPDTSIHSHTYPSPDTFIRPHTYPSPDTFILPQTCTSVKTSAPHVIPALSPTSHPLQTTSLPSLMSPEPTSMAVNITLSSPT